MKKLGWLVVLLLLVSVTGNLSAQDVVAHASVDTNKILIGKPVQLTIQLSQPKQLNIAWPLIIDSVGGMEIWNYSPCDTIKVEDESVLLRSQTFVITSYDSGTYVIPPIVFKYKVKGGESEITAETDPLRIDVYTVPVDTTQDIRDIQGIEAAPFDWKLVLWAVLAFHVVLLVVGLLVWALRKKQLPETGEGRNLLKSPAHIIALEALVMLEEEKVWQNGRLKEYYTRLTDILRIYIDGRWGISTLELTSDEILNTSVIQQLSVEQKAELERVLRLADLVKFAKWQAIPSENEWAMQLSQKFIRETAPQPDPAMQSSSDTEKSEGGSV